ncbi:WXG100 family type VII secretion target [uncultured Enterococcus sp.]|uniref:WXG100 family type VII secretion target n=1 Tax=uncultured Enterococcus sp. TaxID=167972 RepID=UPI002AA8D8A5|nr:WXG100 family type VII secretion target [uncultured Enterococcus sp.]
MSKIEIKGSELGEVIAAASTMEEGVAESLAKAQALQAKVESAKWKGKAKKSFVAYLDLICQYHEDLHSATKKQKKAMKSLKKDISAFDDLAEPSKVRDL